MNWRAQLEQGRMMNRTESKGNEIQMVTASISWLTMCRRRNPGRPSNHSDANSCWQLAWATNYITHHRFVSSSSSNNSSASSSSLIVQKNSSNINKRQYFLEPNTKTKTKALLVRPKTIVFGRTYVFCCGFFLSVRRVISELRRPIGAKFCTMLDAAFNFIIPVQNFGGAFPKNF